MELAPGALFGPYQIRGPLGEGGMGMVWEATDRRLEREVALKVLPEAFVADPDRLARFEREARLLARLNHPNIAQIHGLEVSGEARAIVMELVPGPTLAERIAEGPLALPEFFAVARQVVDALAEAHDGGIVHRDLKPQNVKLAPGGKAKVLDFGIAKRRDPQRSGEEATTVTSSTAAGTVVGTAGYMAPEQVRGEEVDVRADVFSLGCVLFEMLTARRAFAGRTPIETLASILHDEPPLPSRFRSGLPDGLDFVVARCLAKDPARRFSSVREVTRALAAVESAPAPEAPGAPAVAVLPFVPLRGGPEDELFADGITEDVIAHLAKVRALKVIAHSSIVALRERPRSRGEIGERLGATALLEGSVRRAGNRVRIVARLVECATDGSLWAETYDRELTDIFAIQTDVALRIADALSAELTGEERARVRHRPTRDVEAYECYLRGRSWLYRFGDEGYRRATREFQRALSRDPEFAPAYASLAEIHVENVIEGRAHPEEDIRRAKEAVARALALDDELAEAHGISGLIRFVFDYDWNGAERELTRAIELSPGTAELHDHYGWLCAALERWDDALREVRLARELDPMRASSDVASTLLRAGRVEEALEDAQRAAAVEPGIPRCQSTLGWALIGTGRPAEGVAALERAAALAPADTLFLAQLGQAYAVTGAAERARAVLASLRERASREFVSPYHLAYVHTGLGEDDAAVSCLEEAFTQRSGSLYGLKGSFLFATLRGHPRFEALLRRMNLAP